MAKKKLDKDVIKGVSGGEIAINADGKYEVIDGSTGFNVFKDERSFDTAEQAAKIAELIGENTIYMTQEALITMRERLNEDL